MAFHGAAYAGAVSSASKQATSDTGRGWGRSDHPPAIVRPRAELTPDNEDHQNAARETSRVAFVTCTDLPDLEADDRLAADLLARRGVTVVPAMWDDPAVDWSAFDLVVLRSPWNYVPRRDAFLAWAATVPRLVNPLAVIRWNTDKRYLVDLADAGVPVAPTTWVAPGQAWDPPTGGEVVVKPAVGAGSKDAGRYRLADADERRLAADHVARLAGAGRVVMVQPYLPAVDTDGETGVVLLPDPDTGELRYSHAIRKGAMLTGPDVGGGGLYRPERISARAASDAEIALAHRAVAAVPGGAGQLLYARVDMIPGSDGRPVVVELEVTEPSLFLDHDADAPARFAAAVEARLSVTTAAGGDSDRAGWPGTEGR